MIIDSESGFGILGLIIGLVLGYFIGTYFKHIAYKKQ